MKRSPPLLWRKKSRPLLRYKRRHVLALILLLVSLYVTKLYHGIILLLPLQDKLPLSSSKSTTSSHSLESSLFSCPNINNDNTTTPTWVQVTKSPAPTAFYMALHNRTIDPVRWDIARRQRYYETDLEVAWQRILRRAIATSYASTIRILDVGANIGYFGLYSAAFASASVHIVVDAFEPYTLNLQRTCESIQRNGWSANEWQWQRDKQKSTIAAAAVGGSGNAMINLWPWGISNTTTRRMALVTKKNPGANLLLPLQETQTYIEHRKDVVGAPVSVPVATLDDFVRRRQWISTLPPQGVAAAVQPTAALRIEILKIDVETHEAQVILGASQLLSRRVIQHVFVEFTRSPALSERRQLQNQALTILRQSGYTLCGWGSFQGPLCGKVPFDVNQDQNDPDHSSFVTSFWKQVHAQRGIAVNLWWQLDNAQCRW